MGTVPVARIVEGGLRGYMAAPAYNVLKMVH